jgi:hypothetical protein
MLDMWASGKMSNKGLCSAAYYITKAGGTGLAGLSLDPDKNRGSINMGGGTSFNK